jgi:hypothetical protein
VNPLSDITLSPPEIGYTADLKQALTGRRDARFIWLCNFEVEDQWARDYVGLPSVKISATTSTVHRMEQLGALLADPADHLLLGRPLDPGYRDYARGLGFDLPAELLPEVGGETSTSAAVLASPGLLRRLRELAEQGAYLMPMGNSADEQKITEATGLRPAVPDPDVYERVNSKIYSRRLVDELGLRAIPGYCCETVGQLRAALGDGPSAADPVIVKEAYGVSGKGLVVLDSQTKTARLLRMIEARSARTGDDRLHVVVERFLAKRFDLNYQFTIDRTGRTKLDFVKEALTAGGVHKGHVMPADLTPAQYAEIEAAAEQIGARLFADGFVGIVGVDALLGADDLVYPVLEINARLNMSSYQGRVTERFLRPDYSALAKFHPLRLAEPLPWSEVKRVLGDLLAPPVDGSGMVVTCFGTVNAQAGAATPFDGRLYSVLFGRDRDALATLDARIADALRAITVQEGQ